MSVNATAIRVAGPKRATWLSTSSFVGNVASTFAAQVISLALSIGASVIVARYLGPQGKGLVAIAFLVPNMLCLMLDFGIGSANVYFMASRRLSLPELSSNSLMISLISSGIAACSVAIMLKSGLLERIVPGIPIELLLFALLAVPLLLAKNSLASIVQGAHRILTFNFITLLQSFCLLALTLVLVAGMKMGVWGAVLATLFSTAAALIATAIVLRREKADLVPRWNADVLRRTVVYGLKNYIANLLQFFNYRLDLLLVNFFLGTAGAGIYSIAVGSAEMLWYFPNAVAFVLFPKSANQPAAEVRKLIPRVLKYTLGPTLVGAVALALFGKAAIRIVYSTKFLPSYVPMLALLPGIVFLSLSKVLTAHIAGRGFPVFNSYISGLGLLTTIVLDVVLIPKQGVLGASIASTIAYGVHLLASVYFYRKVVHVSEQRESFPVPLQGTAK